MDNCFTSLSSLTAWMAQTRRPNASAPLLVQIGPGRFIRSGSIPAPGEGTMVVTCDPAQGYTGYTSFVGAGPVQTILAYGGGNAVVQVQSCTNLNFSELGIEGPNPFQYAYGIQWRGGGNSSWNHVVVNSSGAGWLESSSCGSDRGSHYWTASRLTTVPSSVTTLAETYVATCDESWFFGSEITVSVPTGSVANSVGGAVMAANNGIIHVYGSVVRALVDVPVSTDPALGFAAVSVGAPQDFGDGGGEIHVHSAGIDLISSTGQNVVALRARNGGSIHANEAAYNFKTTGTQTRILNLGGHVHAPYLWQNYPEVPAILSDNGADMAVVTNTTDGQPHLVIYSSACPSSWYDMVDRACR